MKRLGIMLLAIGLTGIAGAHTLDSKHSVAETLWHQLFGGHHLPFTVVVIAAGVALFALRRWLEKRHTRDS